MVQRQHGPVTSFQHSFLYSFFVILQRFQFSFAEQHTFPGGGVDLKYVRLVRLFGLVRTIRVVRTLPMFMTPRTMLNAIMNSVRSFLWAMVLVWFTMFMFAVAFAQGVTQYAYSSIVADSDMIVLRSCFPSLAATLLTLFMCVTDGVNWWEVIGRALEHQCRVRSALCLKHLPRCEPSRKLGQSAGPTWVSTLGGNEPEINGADGPQAHERGERGRLSHGNATRASQDGC